MTPEEQRAFETALNQWLQTAILIFAFGYWARWGWRKLGLPGIDLRKYWTWEPRDYGKQTEPPAPLDTPKTQHCATPETRNNGVAMGETERNLLLRQGQAKALAALIEAGKVSETEGLRIVYGVAPGSSIAYRDVRALLKEAQAPEYPMLTADGRPVARALRTGVK